MALDDDVIRLAKGPNLATVVTLMPNGQPQALLTWVDTDGEVLLVNTEPQRQRGPRPADDRPHPLGRQPVGLGRGRGHLVGTVAGDAARAHIDELSNRYVGTDYQNPIGPEGRIILRIAADKVNTPAKLFG